MTPNIFCFSLKMSEHHAIANGCEKTHSAVACMLTIRNYVDSLDSHLAIGHLDCLALTVSSVFKQFEDFKFNKDSSILT